MGVGRGSNARRRPAAAPAEDRPTTRVKNSQVKEKTMKQTGKFRRVVIKVGSNVLTREDGRPDTTRISGLVDQFARLHREGIELILVSSGAVASGRSLLESRVGRIDTVSARQLYSAVGQVKLMNRYYDLFNDYGIACGQVLTTKESLSTRRQYLSQRNCMETMLAAGVIPIVNENDTISVTELMFTDNDELSGLVAAMMGADALLILSNIDGIYDGSPSSSSSRVIRRVAPGRDLSPYIDTTRSSRGRGGMTSKSRIASRVAGEGIEVIIANGRRDEILTDLLLRDRDVVCTRFEAASKAASGVKKWIASSEGFAKGALRLDGGAAEAVRRNRAASILAVGVTQVEGDFERDDIVRILSPEGIQLGVGRIACDSATARRNLGRKGLKPLIHCDYLYLEQAHGNEL